MLLGVAATPEVALPTLEWLLRSEHNLDLVITQPDKPSGRGRNMKQTAVAYWATSKAIPIVKPSSSQELAGIVDHLDCIITIGYGVLLPQPILDLPKHGFLNLHFSLLPSYRGAAPAQRALQNGENVTGVSVFKLDKGMDTGPIYTQSSVAIDTSWRSYELLFALAQAGPAAVDAALSMIESGQSPMPQTGPSTLAPKISKQEAKLDFSQDSRTLVNSIRAFTYEPGAWCIWKGEPFKITSALSQQNSSVGPGIISVEGQRIIVGAGNNSYIELLTVIPAGKKEMKASDWARGARLIGGESFD